MIKQFVKYIPYIMGNFLQSTVDTQEKKMRKTRKEKIRLGFQMYKTKYGSIGMVAVALNSSNQEIGRTFWRYYVPGKTNFGEEDWKIWQEDDNRRILDMFYQNIPVTNDIDDDMENHRRLWEHRANNIYNADIEVHVNEELVPNGDGVLDHPLNSARTVANSASTIVSTF